MVATHLIYKYPPVAIHGTKTYTVCHIPSGEEQCYFRAILDNVVPGTDDWYNIQYDNEDQVLSLNLRTFRH